MTQSVTVYTTTYCGPCRRLKRSLDEAGIAYTEVNVEHDETAAEWVMTINAGDRTVPTVKFVDDTTLTNPTVEQVAAKLADLGASAPR
jgi:mycoredoxin